METKKQALSLLDQREVLGKQFRVYGDWENPLFLAKDVAEWIDYTKDNCGYYKTSAMLETIDGNEKILIYGTLSTTNNGSSPTVCSEAIKLVSNPTD